MKNLQYQTSRGDWVNCNGGWDGKGGDRTEEFLALCEQNTGMSREEVIASLESGKTLRNDPADWYSNCRFEPTPRPPREIITIQCDCGHETENPMSASMGSSCTDCYDRMSN